MKQKKTYNRVQCKLIDYTRETTMFAVSRTDDNYDGYGYGNSNRLSSLGVRLYQSIIRIANHAVETGPQTTVWGSVYVPTEDPLIPWHWLTDIPPHQFRWKGRSIEEQMANAQQTTAMTLEQFNNMMCHGYGAWPQESPNFSMTFNDSYQKYCC